MVYDNDNDYDTESSNFTGYVGTVIGAEFEMSERDGKTQLKVIFMTDDPRMPQWTERYSCGAGWLIMDGGRTVKHEEGKIRFMDNTNYGKFIKAAVKAAGYDGVKDKTGSKWTSSKDAESWVGSQWKMVETKGSFTQRDTGEKVEWSKNFPGEFFGWSSERYAQQAPRLENERNGTSSKPEKNPDTVSENYLHDLIKSLPANEQDSMILQAKKLDHRAWMDFCLDNLPGVLDNTMLLKELGNEPGLYTALRAS